MSQTRKFWGMDVCLLWILCCRVEVPGTGRSLDVTSPATCECVCVNSKLRQGGGLGPLRTIAPQEKIVK